MAISGNQWSSVVISATLTCGIARIARRHWRRGTLAASHPSSLINPSPRGRRREIAARSVDLPDEACNQWLMRHRGSRREIAARSVDLPDEACNQWLMRPRGSRREIAARSVDLPAIRSHQRPSSRNQSSSMVIRAHQVASRAHQVAIGLTRARAPHDGHMVPSSDRDCQPLHGRKTLWGI